MSIASDPCRPLVTGSISILLNTFTQFVKSNSSENGPFWILHTGEQVPIHIGQIGSVILIRENKVIKLVKNWNPTEYAILFPERDVSELYGWDEDNINILTDDSSPYSPEMGSPKMRGFLCNVYKA